MDQFLKKIKVLDQVWNRQESLKVGFTFAFIATYGLTEGEEIDELNKKLRKLNLSFDSLNYIQDLKQRHDKIIESLKKENTDRDTWFNIGFWLFMYTRALGRDNFAASTEMAQDLLKHDKVIRKCGATLIEYLMEMGWSPDKVEKFNLNHLIPFLWDEGLRKYVESIHMVPVSVLLHEAKKSDQLDEKNSDTNRGVDAIKALVEEIPIVGKAIAIVVFGNR